MRNVERQNLSIVYKNKILTGTLHWCTYTPICWTRCIATWNKPQSEQCLILDLQVFAVEASPMAEYTRQLVKQNGCEEVVLQGRAEDIHLPERVDILVSEWMGNCLLVQFEFMVESVLLARDCWLEEGGVMWPSSAALTLVPCQANSYYAEKMAFWEQPYELDCTPLQ